ncbi:IS5 family transposase [Francisella sp. SYW-2]|uniref:IS5 family transposase n=1 Tax=Francisella sp. SYW-2 TaxID=2610886 RepID=UPI00123CB311|nr:IS5 family transposase [Francisella sp. SYW-2]
MHYHIKEVFWSSILLFLKSQKGIHTNDEAKLRLFIEAVFYVLRTGCQWRMLPFYYGKCRSIGGVTTKIHAMTDALGNPMEILLSEGKTHDSKVVIDLLQNVYNTKVIADRAYHSNKIREHIQNISSEAVIPSKSNTINPIDFDIQIYKERHLIENFFSKIKHFRRVFSRFDKTISAYLGMIKLACTFIWLR